MTILPFPSAMLGMQTAEATAMPITSLSLDFAGGVYRADGVDYGTLNMMPGYAFTRSGEQGAIAGDGSAAYFPENVPAINARGYHANEAATNLVQQSQSFQTAPWGPYGPVSLIGSDVSLAPDGTMSADEISLTGPSGIYYQGTPGSSPGEVTLSIWARTGSGTMPFRLYVLDGSNQYSPDFTATTAWQRFVFTRTVVSGAAQFAITSSTGGNSGNLQVWQGQLMGGSFADGGPIIRTQNGPAHIGASKLVVSLDNGDYTATYTFDDNSQQVVATNVTDGRFAHPVKGSLNRAVVKKALVIPAA